MGWLASIAVGLCSGVIGFVVALFASVWATEWYRVPQREGAAGFFAFAVAILAFFIAVVVGIVVARHVAAGESPSFIKALGITSAILGGVAVVGLALARLLSDPSPKIDGRPLQLVMEIRGPRGFMPPTLEDPSDAYATMIVLPRGSTGGWSRLRLDETRSEEGHLIVPTTLDLETTAARKLVSIRFGKEAPEMLFELEFGRRPAEKDMQWSRWIEAAYPVGSPKPAADATFHLRYRVQKEPLPPKVLTREEEEAQRLADIRAKFQALSPDAPLADWLQFTHYVNPEDVQKAAATAIQSRPDFTREMAQAIRGSDPDLARLALWSFQYYPVPPISVAADVDFHGQQLVVSLHAFTELADNDPNRSTISTEVSQRFSDWMVATRALQGQGGITFVPILQQIATLSRKSADDHTIRITVLRVASFYLHKWGGIEPLPGDPPPR